MTATGSHEYFYSLRGAQPPGEGLRFAGFLRMKFVRIGACRRPYNAPPGGFPPKNHKKTRPEYSQDGATRAIFKNAHRRGVKCSFQQRNIL